MLPSRVAEPARVALVSMVSPLVTMTLPSSVRVASLVPPPKLVRLLRFTVASGALEVMVRSPLTLDNEPRSIVVADALFATLTAAALVREPKSKVARLALSPTLTVPPASMTEPALTPVRFG